ncbi:hypothetical protein HDU78_009496 [Chytriomyces hyalinus]|nr:hypothetical protein HDU78_009496 [Chytriomyces hyalinus]
MGCGASKATQNDVVQTTTPSIKVDPLPMIAKVAPAPMSVPSIASPVDNASAVEDASVAQGAPIVEVRVPEVDARSEAEANASVLSKAKVPSIPVVSDSGSQTPAKPAAAAAHKPVAFEIPLDEDLFKPVQPQVPASEEPVPQLAGDCVVAAPAEGAAAARSSASAGASANSTKLSLPKLDLSSRDIMAKLANTEERWKDLERQEIRRKRKSKPSLTSASQTTLGANGRPMTAAEATNPAELKQRLLDKEARAAARRARELLKLQNKLAKQEEHARQVQERKKKLGRLSNEALNLSWGGEEEDEVEKAKAYGAALRDAVGIDGIMKMKLQARKDEGLVLDNDSGKGSSAASVNNGSRSGSGRSLGFAEDGTEIIAPL